METLGTQSPHSHHTGWPRWTLWAFTPVALSLGIICGMAGGHYLPSATAATTVDRALADTSEPPPVTPPVQQPVSPLSPPPKDPADSWKIPPQPGRTAWTDPSGGFSETDLLQPPSSYPPGTGPTTAPGQPSDAYGEAKVENITDAKALLQARYNRFISGSVGVYGIDYQVMRHQGQGLAIVGILPMNSYEDWTRALTEKPDELNRWLQQAARTIAPAAERDRLHLSWALVDVVRNRPEEFADFEVTPLANRTYLVIRPLAASTDMKMSGVSVRTLSTLSPAGAHQASLSSDPWNAYRPVINWDSSDLYRPADAMWTKPVR